MPIVFRLYNIIVKVPNHFREEVLDQLLRQQKRLAWDAATCVDWRGGVDFSKPFVPLDKNNILFPDITAAERLAISQYMGLMIAATFSEFELTMQRMRDVCWRPFMEKSAINPELIQLGEEFFDEEAKHASVFQHFLDLSAAELNVAPEDLKNILPRVNPGYVDKILRSNAAHGGMTLWWIVATVEEESTLIYRQMKPYAHKLDPLYFALHRRHFEEEARHAPYPFLMLELANLSHNSTWGRWMGKTDFLVSEILKVFWISFELSKTFEVKNFRNHHPFFAALTSVLPKLKEQSLTGILATLASQAPYISSFINPLYHPQTKKAVAKHGLFHLPFPEPTLSEVNW